MRNNKSDLFQNNHRKNRSMQHEQQCTNCATPLRHDVMLEHEHRVHVMKCPVCFLKILSFPPISDSSKTKHQFFDAMTLVGSRLCKAKNVCVVEAVATEKSLLKSEFSAQCKDSACDAEDDKLSMETRLQTDAGVELPPSQHLKHRALDEKKQQTLNSGPIEVSCVDSFLSVADKDGKDWPAMAFISSDNKKQVCMPCCKKIVLGLGDKGAVQHLIENTQCFAKMKALVKKTRDFSDPFKHLVHRTDKTIQAKAHGCRCSKTKCVRRYCECFGNNLFCGPCCSCNECYNDGKHERERLSALCLVRREATLQGKSIFFSDFYVERTQAVSGSTTSKAYGCKCSQTGCVKRYCSCYAAGVECNFNCICVGCKNVTPKKSKRRIS